MIGLPGTVQEQMHSWPHKHGIIIKLGIDAAQAVGYTWVFAIEPIFSKPMPKGVHTLAMARKVANAMLECMQ